MNIAIIGAGLAGLAAGRILARAGHEVVIFEKSHDYGGRLASRTIAHGHPVPVDHGAPFIPGPSKEMANEYVDLLQELTGQSIIRKWTGLVSQYRDGKLHHPGSSEDQTVRYIAPAGMNAIGRYLGRWMDLHFGEKVAGITHIGGLGVKKKPWIINSSGINVFEADAVIIATSAIEAYGLVSTAQDELEMRKMITVLDDIPYTAVCSLAAVYEERRKESWSAISCDHPYLSWVFHESEKRDTAGQTILLAHSTDAYAKHIKGPEITGDQMNQLLQALSEVLGAWAGKPVWHESHFWNYARPKKSLPYPYLESLDEQAPLAVVGDYFQQGPNEEQGPIEGQGPIKGQASIERQASIEGTYLSGVRLGSRWVEKFS